MSETFEKILVKDDRLGCITPKVKYQVFKGGQNITCQAYTAISQSTKIMCTTWRFQVWRRSFAERCSGNRRSPSGSLYHEESGWVVSLQ